MQTDTLPEIREVPGFTGYGASADGRIWSRRLTNGMLGAWREKAQTISARGYAMVYTSIDGSKRNLYAHRMVWMAFNGEIPADRQINHIDGRKTRNATENLELVTRAENTAHAYRVGLAAGRPGARHHRATLTDNDVLTLIAGFIVGGTREELANHFGLSRSHVTDIVAGRKWKHLFAPQSQVGACRSM